MYIYKLNEDGVSCGVHSHHKEKPMPDGFAQVPPEMEGKSLYMVDGELTNESPQSLVDEEQARWDAEEKIQGKMRDLAIKELIVLGDLPVDFKDENIKRGR
jgi:hypothetical protein